MSDVSSDPSSGSVHSETSVSTGIGAWPLGLVLSLSKSLCSANASPVKTRLLGYVIGDRVRVMKWFKRLRGPIRSTMLKHQPTLLVVLVAVVSCSMMSLWFVRSLCLRLRHGCGGIELRRYAPGRWIGFTSFPAKATLPLIAVLLGLHCLKRLFEFRVHFSVRFGNLNHRVGVPVFFISEHGPGNDSDLAS